MTDPHRQLSLPLDLGSARGREDFLVSASNRHAFDAAMSDAPDQRLALSGPAGAGKSHLAAIWAAGRNGAVVPAATLDNLHIEPAADAAAIAVEDADRMSGNLGFETRLLHLMNVTASHRTALLLTGRAPPARWQVATPDLASRLAALQHVAIEAPDDALLSSILDKLFSDRQLSVGSGVTAYLVKRMERSFAAAERVVAHLDHLALSTNRPLTRKLAGDLYRTDPGAIAGAGED